MGEVGVDVNKATTEAIGHQTALHLAVLQGHIDVAVYLMERGMADLNARITTGRRPMDLAPNEAMRQAIIIEEKRHRDHGFKRSVVPNSTTITEQECNENGEEGQVKASAVTAGDEEEEEEEEEDEVDDDDNEDSGSSDEEDEV